MINCSTCEELLYDYQIATHKCAPLWEYKTWDNEGTIRLRGTIENVALAIAERLFDDCDPLEIFIRDGDEDWQSFVVVAEMQPVFKILTPDQLENYSV